MYTIYKNTLFYFFNLQKKQKEQVNFIFYLFFFLLEKHCRSPPNKF